MQPVVRLAFHRQQRSIVCENLLEYWHAEGAPQRRALALIQQFFCPARQHHDGMS
jgi:hypothetical protein